MCMQEFGVGDGVWNRNKRNTEVWFWSTLYYVTVGEEVVEVDSQDLHEPDNFLKCLE